MSDTNMKTYNGNCHCGAFRFELNVPEIKSAGICNCNVCFKKDYLRVFPAEDQFKVIKGGGSLSDYQSGDQGRIHKFCPTCGSGVLMENRTQPPGSASYLQVNVRMLLDVNPFALEVSSLDVQKCPGSPADIQPFAGDLPSPNFEIEGSKLYTGSCACGAVTVAIKTKPLPETEIKEDNCSICQRNANMCLYPHQSQVTITNKENCTEYLFGRKFTGHCFCKTCGVPVYMKIHGPPKAVFDRLPEARRNALRGNFEILPVRVRLLDRVEWEELKVERSDEGTEGYVVT